MGKQFWHPLLEFMSERLVKEQTIDQSDLDRLIVTDSAQTAVDAITEVGLTYGARIKRRWFFGETEPG
jgi:predicted Rossmann-fold nucleotide-binding protein